MSTWQAVLLGYHLASRLAYVIGVGTALRLQQRRQHFTRRAGIEVGFRKFRRLAAFVMNNDALSFLILCLGTRGTLSSGLPPGVRWGLGIGGIIVGMGTKLWAARSLGAGAYHWRDTFDPAATEAVADRGPYRWLRNPMYTVGYLHAYGIALLADSGVGLLAAGFDQAAILAFYYWVEKPHFARVTAGGNGGQV